MAKKLTIMGHNKARSRAIDSGFVSSLAIKMIKPNHFCAELSISIFTDFVCEGRNKRIYKIYMLLSVLFFFSIFTGYSTEYLESMEHLK